MMASGMSSNQSTLRRTRALGRPSTAYGEMIYTDRNYHNGDFGGSYGDQSNTSNDMVTHSVDLRSSLERDMLIEQNQILARELQTLKHKFVVELETRKIQQQ